MQQSLVFVVRNGAASPPLAKQKHVRLEMAPGESAHLPFACIGEDKEPVDITGWLIRICLRQADSDVNPIASRLWVPDGTDTPSGGLGHLDLLPGDTQGVSPGGARWDVQADTPSGAHYQLQPASDFCFTEVVGQPTDVSTTPAPPAVVLAQLPPVTTADNGDALRVVNGAWAKLGYQVGAPSQWAGSPPQTPEQAIDRLAAAIYALRGNSPIP